MGVIRDLPYVEVSRCSFSEFGKISSLPSSRGNTKSRASKSVRCAAEFAHVRIGPAKQSSTGVPLRAGCKDEPFSSSSSGMLAGKHVVRRYWFLSLRIRVYAHGTCDDASNAIILLAEPNPPAHFLTSSIDPSIHPRKWSRTFPHPTGLSIVSISRQWPRTTTQSQTRCSWSRSASPGRRGTCSRCTWQRRC